MMGEMEVQAEDYRQSIWLLLQQIIRKEAFYRCGHSLEMFLRVFRTVVRLRRGGAARLTLEKRLRAQKHQQQQRRG